MFEIEHLPHHFDLYDLRLDKLHFIKVRFIEASLCKIQGLLNTLLLFSRTTSS